jgi:hypothetical protein
MREIRSNSGLGLFPTVKPGWIRELISQKYYEKGWLIKKNRHTGKKD